MLLPSSHSPVDWEPPQNPGRFSNRLAAAALLATYTTHKTIADTTAVRAAITEVNDQ